MTSAMLRVAMITDFARPGDAADGGVQAVTRYLVDALAKRGDLDIHLIGFDYSRKDPETVEQNGVNFHTLPGAAGGAATGYRRDQQVLDRLLAGIDPDVVHGQGAGQNGVVAVRSRFPSLITIHGIMAEEAKFRSGIKDRLRHTVLGMWSDHYCIRNGRHTILITPYVADYFGDRLAGRHYFIPNPVADEYFSLGRHDEALRVLFAGRLYKLKGVLDLVQAIAKIRDRFDVELWLAGSMHDRDYVDELNSLVSDLGLGEHVRFLGLLDAEEFRKALSESSVLVLPSYQETAPMVIAEAMAAAVPVLATDVGGIRYQVIEGDTGYLVMPGDVDQIANRLDRLLGDRNLRNSLGETARAKAESEYRADRVADQTVAVYRTVHDERRR